MGYPLLSNVSRATAISSLSCQKTAFKNLPSRTYGEILETQTIRKRGCYFLGHEWAINAFLMAHSLQT